MIKDYLPWLLSVLTIYMTFLQGEKHQSAWIVGLFNQVLWLLFAVTTHTWGLLPLNAALWYLYIRNFIKWDMPLMVAETNPFIERSYVFGEVRNNTYRLIVCFRTKEMMAKARDYINQLPNYKARH